MARFIFIGLFLSLFLLAGNANAQRFTKKKKYFSLGAEFNQNLFHGDLYSDLLHVRSGFGLHGQYKLNPSLSFHVGWNYAMIYANDMDAPQESQSFRRALGFLSRSNQINALIKWDIIENRKYFKDRSRNNVYGLIGAGVNFSNVKFYEANDSDNIRHHESFVMMNAGLGYSFKASELIDIYAEFRNQIFFEDLLDNLKGDGPDQLRTIAIGMRFHMHPKMRGLRFR